MLLSTLIQNCASPLTSHEMLLPRAAATGCLLALALVTLLSLLTPTDALIIRIPSGQEYCFFEEASKADKIVGNYKVLEGGELDIDLRITDPKGRMIFETTKKREESFQFFALQDGEYTLCLSNKFSMILGKTVVFNLHLGASLAKKDAAKVHHFSPLESGVMKLGQNIGEVHDWTSHMKSRERIHHLTVISTNFRLTLWRSIQIFSLLALAVAKIIYLRNLFESKRGV